MRFPFPSTPDSGGMSIIGQSVDMAVEERYTVALFRGCGKVRSRNN